MQLIFHEPSIVQERGRYWLNNEVTLELTYLQHLQVKQVNILKKKKVLRHILVDFQHLFQVHIGMLNNVC